MRGTVTVSYTGAAAVVSVVFSGVRCTVVAGTLSKETARFLRGVPCGEADDDEEDDGGASGGGDAVVVSAAPSFPTMGVGGPREPCFASLERQEDLPGDEGDGDDEEDDDGASGGGDAVVVSAATLVSADSFLSPLTVVKLAKQNFRGTGPLVGLLLFSSAASVTPWRARRKAEEVSGSYSRSSLAFTCNLSAKRDSSFTFDVHFLSQGIKQ